MDIFFQTFSKYIKPSDTLILGVSGGVDSMVLFDMVIKHHPREKIIVAHFDHSLRWVESDSDRELVASICKSENITFEVKKMDIKQLAKTEKKSIEHIARDERYSFFREIRDTYKAKYIFTAHHLDDQAETILMGMIKWWKTRWLSGMSVVAGDICRPLLGTPKKALYQYANEHTIVYREDSTNTDTQFERNHVRQNIIPLLEKINPTINETLGELGEYIQELADFIHARLDTWFLAQEMMTQEKRVFLTRSFLCESVFFQREIIACLYHRAHGGSTQWLSRGAIDECLRFIREASNSHGIKEIKKLRLDRRGEKIIY